MVYGSNELTASILRGGPASPGARLRTSNDINGDSENLLPQDAFGPRPDAPFVAGDDRTNDNIVLTAMHTLFMREHNRLVDVFAAAHPEWGTEELYQRARKIVGAEIQSITVNEFLPALLGTHAPAAVGQYNPDLNPTVVNEFPDGLPPHRPLDADQRLQLRAEQRRAGTGRPLAARRRVREPGESHHLGRVRSVPQGIKRRGPRGIGPQHGRRHADRARRAFDIQRARDHGIPDYNTLREAYGLPRVTTYAEITADVDAQTAIATVYPNINTIDPLVGAMGEDHLPGANMGPLVAAGFLEQFERLDGDRFWYEHDPDLTADEKAELREMRLSDIIRRNTEITNLQENVFFVPEPGFWPMMFSAVVLFIKWRRLRRLRVRAMSERRHPRQRTIVF